MGSKTFNGVWFSCFSDDHLPPHVHGKLGGVRVILDVLPDGSVREAARWNAVTPPKAKRGDVRRILRVAAEHGAELWTLWEKTHG